MRIDIIGRNYNPPERLRNVIEKKSEKLNRYFDVSENESHLSSFIDKDAVAKFVCSQEKNRERFTLEGTIYFGDRIVRVEETSDNIYDNVDKVIPKLERQIRKLRTKFEKSFKAPQDAITPSNDAEEEEKSLKVVRTKHYELKPMTDEQAIEQLEMLDHNFFIYLNPDTGKVNVMYKRNSGDVGVINCDY